MPGPKINVRVTFVSVKAGSSPPVKIENSVDITQHLPSIGLKDFDTLRDMLEEIVANSDFELFFHKDTTSTYSFDEAALPNGAIYGLKEKRKEGDYSKKITAVKVRANSKVMSRRWPKWYMKEEGDAIVSRR